MEEVRSSILRTPEDGGFVVRVLPVETAEKERTRWRRGEVFGVARLSWCQVSAGSWKGSASSLPLETVLSARSREEEEEEEEEGSWVCD